MNNPNIACIEETDSTSSYLKKLSGIKKLPQGFTVYAGFQSSGKGQKGSSWESARGMNLLFSMLLYPDMIKANKQFLISQIVSLAVADFLKYELDGICIQDISIKWPNDIYWQEKKICGILIENSLVDDTIKDSVVGIGINVNQENFESDAPNPVSLKQITGRDYNLVYLLNRVCKNILNYYSKLKDGDYAFIERYKESLFRKNGVHTFSDEQGTFKAEILDVEDSGILVLKKESGEIRQYAFKQVKFVL